MSSQGHQIKLPSSSNPLRVMNVAGARPNFMKIAPIVREMGNDPRFEPILVHTGQHYDKDLSENLFRELEIPEPHENLNVGSGSHAVQTARIMEAFEPVVQKHRPDLVLVVGDVNSTIGCAIVASKLHIPIAHVEAGLRSFNRKMPEEVNRVMTDSISDYLFTTEPAGIENLLREGAVPSRIFSVGNVMIDTLLRFRTVAGSRPILADLGLTPSEYGVVTLHRPENVDSPEILKGVVSALLEVAKKLPLVFPVHPRTRRRLEDQGLLAGLEEEVRLLPPSGYLDFLALMAKAKVVLTDSGGIQEEATVLSVPCLTLRDTTERPITLTCGTNVLTGTDPRRIVAEVTALLTSRPVPQKVPPYWDGRAARRIVEVLAKGVSQAPRTPPFQDEAQDVLSSP